MNLKSPNFSFLEKHDPLLVRYAALAEKYVFEDPDTALIQLRKLGEGLASFTATYVNKPLGEKPNFCNLISDFCLSGVITRELADIWHTVRQEANEASHYGNKQFSQSEALTNLRHARTVAVWFHRSFGKDSSFRPGPFVPPAPAKDISSELAAELEIIKAEMRKTVSELENAKLIAKDYEEKAARAYQDLEAAMSLAEESETMLAKVLIDSKERLATAQTEVDALSDEELSERISQAGTASENLELSESETRKIIDRQLRDAGWEVDSERLDYRNGSRPQKGKFLAIAEWPTETGPADYVLFDGLYPLAVVEAKRRNRNVASYIGTQSTRYSQGFKFEGDAIAHKTPWGKFKVPFLFSANGRPFIEQLKDESGIWFRDARRAVNLAYPLLSWYSPEGLRQKLRQDIDLADSALKEEPVGLLPLRKYQQAAIKAVENALLSERRAVLLAMATGTGKTRVCVCLIYRLIKTKRFRRALFLVDRTSLGDQALDENFKHIKLDDGRPFTDIYDVKDLHDIHPETDTKLHIATIQGMMKRILYPEAGAPPPPVDTYDLIVIDECHRGYTLDRDLNDNELSFRSEDEYLSKYRRVLDYFDAAKVGVTATPALHTTQIFGRPVFNYSYREAVVDDVLVDHQPPFRINTRLGRDGILWEARETIQVYHPRTGQMSLFNTPDEVKIEINDFNKSVITESFNKAVCSALAKEIDPATPGKTLVFCVDDSHADMVVRILKDAFKEQYGEVEDEAVVKITGAPNTDRPRELLRKYKNERFPAVAVTVDYLTTGVDVPSIVNIVFIRKVRSRILFEQMLGRGTRKSPDLYGSGDDKDSFRIFDAVDIYSTLAEFNTMLPVVTSPKIRFAQLLEELSQAKISEHQQEIYEQLVTKLNRRLKRISRERAQDLETLTGFSAPDLRAHVRSLSPEQAKEYFRDKARIAQILDEQEQSEQSPKYISQHPDHVLSVEQGYGDYEKPEDYLEAFSKYLNENKNKIPALLIVTTRPSKLTKKELRELKLALDRAGFPEKMTETAYTATNQQCAASIIGFIRRATLGSPLVPYEQRVARAMEKIYKLKPWSEPQKRWLRRFEKQLCQDVILDTDTLNTGLFVRDGGFDRINKVFDGRAEQLFQEIQDELWKDVA